MSGLPYSVREFLDQPRPSKRPGYVGPKRERYGKRYVRRLRAELADTQARITALEQLLASMAIRPAPSLIPEVARAVSEHPDQLIPPREGPIADSRRPDPVALEEKAQATEERHRRAAEAWRKYAFAMNLAAARGLGARRWSSIYWNSSPYKSGL